MNPGMYSSASDEWSTPQYIFDQLHLQYNFTLDVCATKENAKCAKYFTKEDDGLAQDWTGACFMNPPYGRAIGKWVRKARLSAGNGTVVVCLLPARTDTKWFHEDVLGHGTITFIKGRLKFGHAGNSAPFPSMIVEFK